MKTNKIINGDCIEVMKTFPDNSFDAIVTDPPYELGFMGKSWDNTGIANDKNMWKECLRVLKSGGYLLSFGGTRTYHRMAVAIEDAGFEVRDMIEWVYGSGFPKSLNIGKAVDKLHGNEREIVGSYKVPDIKGDAYGTMNDKQGGSYKNIEVNNTQGISEWKGWGTALKPAHEPICMARKPLAEKTVAENCLRWGVGGIDIYGSRVGIEVLPEQKAGQAQIGTFERDNMVTPERTGRFPANLIHDGSPEVLKEFEKYGVSESKKHNGDGGKLDTRDMGWGFTRQAGGFEDSGTPSRFFKSCPYTESDFNYPPFFYTAKASSSERNDGCEELEEKTKVFNGQSDKSSNEMKDVEKRFTTLPKTNNHPTVKPVELMKYLVKLVTKENALVLDPFLGSGTTAIACRQLCRNFIGIEKEAEYVKIAEARIKDELEQKKLFEVISIRD